MRPTSPTSTTGPAGGQGARSRDHGWATQGEGRPGQRRRSPARRGAVVGNAVTRIARAKQSMSGLLSVLNEAARAGLCTQVVCTTCGAGPYRKALGRAQRHDPLGFTEALASLPFESWLPFENPRGAVF